MWGKEHFTGKPKAWALHLVLPLTSYMTLTKTQSHCAWISSSRRMMKPSWSICWVLFMCQALRSPLYLNYFTQQSFFEQLLFIRCISYTMSLNSHNISMKKLFLWFPFCRREDWETSFLEQASPIVSDREKIWTQSSLITKPVFIAPYIPHWPWSGWP